MSAADALIQHLLDPEILPDDAWSRRAYARIADLEREIARLREDAARRGATEAERLQAEKLDALGRLAAGLAHEINTPLQFIGDNLAFLSECHGQLTRLAAEHRTLHAQVAAGSLPPAEVMSRVAEVERISDLAWIERNLPPALAECVEGLKRVREIVQTLKDFARPIDGERKDADVNEALVRALVMARPEYTIWADVETDLADVPRSLCTLQDLHQVFYNLILNASQAIADRRAGQGRIRVATRHQGEHVVATITDDGCGIPEALQPRLFEYSFSHPSEGRSAGRGLAIAWSIVVQKNGGTMRFESSVGRGTTFEVLLPAFVQGSVTPAS